MTAATGGEEGGVESSSSSLFEVSDIAQKDICCSLTPFFRHFQRFWRKRKRSMVSNVEFACDLRLSSWPLKCFAVCVVLI